MVFWFSAALIALAINGLALSRRIRQLEKLVDPKVIKVRGKGRGYGA